MTPSARSAGWTDKTDTVAHELKNVLTVIRCNADLLDRHFGRDNQGHAILRDIRQALVRACELVQHMTEVGPRTSTPVALAPWEVVGSLSEVLKGIVPRSVEVICSLDHESGRVWIDPWQFEQVLLNLVTNARDAMPAGGALEITVAAAEVTSAAAAAAGLPAGSYVRVTVADTGSGMDERTRRRCLDPHFSTKGVGGTGLGLPAVCRTVHEFNGALSFDTELDRGTSFEVLLPAIDEEIPGADATPFPIRRNLGSGSEMVLVAEADNELRRLISTVLSHDGYRVLQAATGAQALELGKNHAGRIEVLISETTMPGHHGADIASRLRGDRPDLALVLLSDGTASAGCGRPDPIRAGHLTKPFKPSDLLAALRRELDGQNHILPGRAD